MATSQNFSIADFTSYIPAVLHEQKTGDWRIVYYALHPQTKDLTRVRLRVNKIKDHHCRKSDARRHIAEMIQVINAKLAGGWSPFFEGEDARLYKPLPEVLDLFLKEHAKEVREHTMRSYTSFCKMLTEWASKHAPKVYFSLFNHNYAIRYMDYVYNTRNVSGITYNNYLKLGRAIFNWGTEKCYTKQNAFERIKPKRKEQKTRTIVPPEYRRQITAYLREQNNLPLEIVVNLIYSSLIRPKEIQQLRIKDVHLDEKYIVVPADVAKTHKQRVSALTDHSIELLREYLTGKKYKPDFFLFGSGENNYAPVRPGETMTGYRRFGKEWDKLVKKLEIPKEMQLYSFRDTGIWEMLKSGIDDLSVMQHADHSSLDITTRYANHFDKGLVEKINKLVPDF